MNPALDMNEGNHQDESDHVTADEDESEVSDEERLYPRLVNKEQDANLALVSSKARWLLLLRPFLHAFSLVENRWCMLITFPYGFDSLNLTES